MFYLSGSLTFSQALGNSNNQRSRRKSNNKCLAHEKQCIWKGPASGTRNPIYANTVRCGYIEILVSDFFFKQRFLQNLSAEQEHSLYSHNP